MDIGGRRTIESRNMSKSLRINEILHQIEKRGTIVPWYSQGDYYFSGIRRWCEKDFAHSIQVEARDLIWGTAPARSTCFTPSTSC